jgi:hypothetical protein
VRASVPNAIFLAAISILLLIYWLPFSPIYFVGWGSPHRTLLVG